MKIKSPAFGFGSLLLAGAAMFAAVPANAQGAPQAAVSMAAQPASISQVAVDRAGQLTTVRISGTGDLRYQSSRLDSPPRLVLDFSAAQLAPRLRKISSTYAPVVAVRVGQPVPGKSRVVIDLSQPVSFTDQSDASSVTISFAAPAAVVAPAAFHPVRTPAERKLASVRAPEMPLPASLTGGNLGFARPANAPAAPQPQAATTVPQTAATASPTKKYTGDPISVNLKDVDLKDFFRLIHEISGLNVVLDPSVHGTVTLVLDEVPWDQGLDIVLRNNGLTKEIDGNVLRIATQDKL